MADKNDKNPRNVTGSYYVDTTCIDCDLCRAMAPEIFRRDDETGLTFVHRQPETTDETGLAEEAKGSCPTESIGNDGDSAIQSECVADGPSATAP